VALPLIFMARVRLEEGRKLMQNNRVSSSLYRWKTC